MADQETLSEALISPDDGGHALNEDDPFSEIVAAGEIVVDPLQAQPQGGRRQAQVPEFRDAPFAVGFVAHILLVLFLAVFWGIGSLMRGKVFYDVRCTGLLGLAFLTSLISVGLAAASLEVMTRHGERLIQLSVFSSCGFMGLIVLVLFSKGAILLACLWLVALLVTAVYAYSVWHRIPFAASNLRTAVDAIQTNYGVCLLGYTIAFCGNMWVLVWSLAVIGVYYRESCDEDGVCESSMDSFSMLLLILSYYWTAQVLKNVLHVTIAGVVGTWWFAPQEGSSLFAPAIVDSFRRATTFSFGSICMGSLLMAIIQTLQQIANLARRQSRAGGMLLCIAECILFYIEAVAKYFNRWAFVYVGLYGDDYLTSGEKVLGLFRERGWSIVVSDDLVNRTLALASAVIGALTGLVGMLLARATGWATPVLGEGNGTAVFTACFFIGYSLSNITMSMVCVAVDTVIVSFAEAPAELQTNHPALSRQMITAWNKVYPEECRF